MTKSRLKDRIILFAIALSVVLVAKFVIDSNGGLTHLIDRALTGSLEKVCENDPNNPECKAAAKTLKEQPLSSPSPQPTQK